MSLDLESGDVRGACIGSYFVKRGVFSDEYFDILSTPNSVQGARLAALAVRCDSDSGSGKGKGLLAQQDTLRRAQGDRPGYGPIEKTGSMGQ